MTTKEKLIKMLVDRGMLENDAKIIVERSMPIIDNYDGYKYSWDGPSSGYPDQLYCILFWTVKEQALIWIKENCPEAWYRPVFDPEHPLHSELKEKGLL